MSAQAARNYSDEAVEKLKMGGDTEKAKVYAELAKAAALLELARVIQGTRFG